MSLWRIGVEAASGRPAMTVRGDAVRGEAGASSFGAEFFDKLTKWIPAEVLAIYVPGVTVIATSDKKPSLAFLIVMICVSPLVVLLSAFASRKKITRPVWASAGLGTIAFAIWAFSIPMNGWHRVHFVETNGAIFSVCAVVAAMLFALFADGVLERITS